MIQCCSVALHIPVVFVPTMVAMQQVGTTAETMVFHVHHYINIRHGQTMAYERQLEIIDNAEWQTMGGGESQLEIRSQLETRNTGAKRFKTTMEGGLRWEKKGPSRCLTWCNERFITCLLHGSFRV